MQALKDESLRAQMRLIVNHGMREAFARGETMRRDLLSQVDKGAETFFIVICPVRRRWPLVLPWRVGPT